MNLYNMMNGVNPATFFVLPLLGKHPDSYPRFRDCSVNDAGNIVILTRTGGPNRGTYFEDNSIIEAMSGLIRTYDDPKDSTYACWEFSVPEEWKEDFALVMSNRLKECSTKYQYRLKTVYPKLILPFEELFR